MKKGIRVLGFDDGFFKPRSSQKTVLIAVLYNISGRVEGIASGRVRVDGFNSTSEIVRIARSGKFKEQVSFIMLSGVNFAGFNIADISKIAKQTGKPVIVVFRKKPNFEKIRLALQKLSKSKKRFELIEKAGVVKKASSVFFQFKGCSEQEARQLIAKSLQHSNIPEPLRLAHLIASAVTLGESTRP